MNGNGNSVAYVGIDLGCDTAIVASSTGQILRNEMGGISTSTLVGFLEGKERLLGEHAVAQLSANVKNTVLHLPRFIGRSYDEIEREDVHLRRYHMFDVSKGEDGGVLINVGGQSYRPVELLAMLMGKLRSYKLVEGEDSEHLSIAFAVPQSFPREHALEVYDAARIAGLSTNDVSVVYARDALLAAYRQKHSASVFQADGTSKKILIVEMGHTQTNVLVASINAEGFPQVLAQASDLCLGASNFDDQLFQHFQAEIKGKYGEEIVAGNKKAWRVLKACLKLRHLLSTLPVAHAQVENVVEGRDIDLNMKREDLQGMVKVELDRFRQLLTQALESSGVINNPASELDAVEITGGAMRMPILQEVLLSVTGYTSKPLGLKMDDSAIAFGAALLAKGVFDSLPPSSSSSNNGNGGGEGVISSPPAPSADDNEAAATTMEVDTTGSADGGAGSPHAGHPVILRGVGRLSEDEISRLKAEEARRQQLDADLRALAEVRNSMEAFVLQLRGIPSTKQGHLVDRSKVNAFADELENWLYSEEADNASLEDATTKLEEAKQQARERYSSYYEAVEKEKAEYEAALDEEARKEREEREANGEEDDDHDNRKLKKADRMKLAMKNKDEGNELFSGGNYKHAGARYAKALTHCSKFFDLSAEDEAEVKKLKVSLYSNLAMCYLKMENWDAAIKNCEEGIKLDDGVAKLFFRKASAYEKKKLYDEADRDLSQASRLAPEDKGILALAARVKVQLKRQAEKEKAMWSKAFAS